MRPYLAASGRSEVLRVGRRELEADRAPATRAPGPPGDPCAGKALVIEPPRAVLTAATAPGGAQGADDAGHPGADRATTAWRVEISAHEVSSASEPTARGPGRARVAATQKVLRCVHLTGAGVDGMGTAPTL